jgi:hypothetical protein
VNKAKADQQSLITSDLKRINGIVGILREGGCDTTSTESIAEAKWRKNLWFVSVRIKVIQIYMSFNFLNHHFQEYIILGLLHYITLKRRNRTLQKVGNHIYPNSFWTYGRGNVNVKMGQSSISYRVHPNSNFKL